MADWFVIFGARVNRDGSPSGALTRRVDSAIEVARTSRSPMFLATGGRGRSGYVEAEVMCRMLLRSGAPRAAIVCEGESRNTLESVCKCRLILRERGDVDRVFVCSDSYHQWRCRLLFALLGIRTEATAIPSAAREGNLSRYAYMVLREMVAIPVDGALMLLRRLAHRV